MTLHVVLFTPREGLADVERDALGRALEGALTKIPSVRAYRVGRRVSRGTRYDALSNDFDYCAIVEFDDATGLQAYLEHPAHVELGRLFYATNQRAFAGDFEATDRGIAEAVAAWR